MPPQTSQKEHQQLRVVGGVRLSSLTEDTTSPARQKEMIQNWADQNNAVIVGWAMDLDVSAGIPPWERPELGPWIKERHEQYDALVFAKLDRAVRKLADFVDLDRWATTHGKGLVILDPPLDLTDMWGRAMAQMLATFAELERGMIKKRTLEGYEALVKAGRWPGGRVPYGYKTVRRPGFEGWWLVVDQEQAEVLRTIVGRIVAGASVLSQVKWLNDEKIPTARGATGWQHTALYDMLKSRALLGQWPLADGDVARDEEGMPVQRADPILTRQDWERLQETLKGNAHNRSGNRRDAAPLLRVAFCGHCERPMYRQGTERTMARGNKVGYFYYRCASTADSAVENCPDRAFRAAELESIVFKNFLDALGGAEVRRKVFVPGEDHTEALETAQSAYNDLSQQLTITRSTSGRKRILDQLTALDGRIEELEGQPNKPSHWDFEGTGETYRELWLRLTAQERGALLRDAGVKALVIRTKDGTPVASLVLPEDLEERAQTWAAGREAG